MQKSTRPAKKPRATLTKKKRKFQLLLAIREIFQTWKPDHSQRDLLHTRPDHISSKDLLDELIDREGEQWAVSWKMDIDDGNTQRPATKLARLLKPFGIVPKTFRESGDTTLKGYSLSSFDEAFARYLPPFSSPI